MSVAVGTALALPGLKPVDRSLETHWVRPAAATAVRLEPGDGSRSSTTTVARSPS